MEARASGAFPLPSGVWSDQHVATFLHRIGRWAFRRRRLVSGVRLGVLVVAVVAAAMAPAGRFGPLADQRAL
ncbi:hypothetical protein TPA0910_68330 [Streptomyces hygroscopicus subsp. sporocinereus]|uniref:ABC transporter permease n=1 Tax=Streptomyces hygroscopicus TaxID=1912 RepID=A0ABQ3U9W6_STRHY|nr:hypothetical protein TPA0910_68330 [Streptomyces hygroscopicus]